MQDQPTAVFRLSPQQKAVWQSQPPEARCNAVCLAEIEGAVSAEKLRAAVTALVQRHEVLRTVYRLQPGMKAPFQAVLEFDEPSWEAIDASASPGDSERVQQICRQEQLRPFDLNNGPVFRAVLVSLAAERAALILSAPSLAADNQSFDVMVRELAALYAGRADRLAADPLRYAQFAQWQLDLIEADDESAADARAWWSGKASSAALPLTLPESRTADGPADYATVSSSLSRETVDRLEAMAQEAGLRPGAVLLAAWQSLLWRLTGQTSFETPALFSGREYEELEGAVGVVGKFIPVDARFDGSFSLRDVASHAHRAMEEASRWQEYFVPGQEGGAAAAFDYCELPAASESGGVRFRITNRRTWLDAFAVRLSAVKAEGEVRLELHFDTKRISEAAAERWLVHYKVLTQAGVAASSLPVAALPLLTPEQLTLIATDWNQTSADYPRSKRLHELFEEQAAETPDRIAVRAAGLELTYAALNERANRLARHLLRRGVAPQSQVGLAVDRSVHMVAGLLAILKAGCAYVPLNADNPRQRLAAQLQNAAALITDEALASRMPTLAVPVIRIDADGKTWDAETDSNPGTPGTPEDLVYVIFTSGSTGTPKGVGVRHRNLVNYAHSLCEKLGARSLSEPLHFATVSTLSADLGNTCIFPSLISGGCLHVISHQAASDSAQLAAYCRQNPVDVLKIVPSHLEALLVTAEGVGVLPRKWLVTGGEALSVRLARRILDLAPQCRILNHYGPTETTVGSLTFPVDADVLSGASQDDTIPIGRPIANTRVYVLDELRQPVPPGVSGELYIAGEGVTAGYLGEPALTAERFVECPFGAGLMYRTGDVVRFRGDSNVQFLGRGDDQVKIRGFRIEPGEVEAAIRKYPGIRQAAVIARRDPRGDMRLIGYLVANPGEQIGVAALRDFLKEQLPEYMVPAGLVNLPKLPLTPNGKIDRQSLPEPEQVQTKVMVAPRTPSEMAVAGIWSEVFRRDTFSVDDDFFAIGGHSLTATQVISRVREQFQVMLDIRVVFDRPTIEGMAAAIEAARRSPLEDEPVLMAVSRERYRRK